MDAHTHTAFPSISEGAIGGAVLQTVNARDLHAFIGNRDHFATWIKDRIRQYGFTKNVDFVAFSENSEKGRPSDEYAISLDMAKEIAMVERNEKGRQVRQYFIACERMMRELTTTITTLGPEARSAIGGIVKGIVHREIAALLPAAIDSALVADPRRAALDYVSVRQLLDEAKAVQKGRNSLNRRCGYDLRRRALKIVSAGEPSPVRRCPASGVMLFKRDMAEQFMRERGHGLVAAHNAKQVGGQAIIVFPDRRKSSADKPAPAAL